MNTNYQNGKIYKIVDNVSDMVYVGSTCKTLQHRLKQHEAAYKSFKAGKFPNNVTVFKILENADYKIELIENYPCTNKQELNIREGKIIKQFKNDKINIVNKNIAGQTPKEYDDQYYQSNKQIINNKKNAKHNCFCGGKFTNTGKSHHEKTKKHCQYINNSKNINIETLNLNITVNNPDDLNIILDKLKNTIK